MYTNDDPASMTNNPPYVALMSAVQARNVGWAITCAALRQIDSAGCADAAGARRVSGTCQATKPHTTTPAIATATMAKRQPPSWVSKPPRVGLAIASRPRPDMALDITCAPSWGSYRSRTMARAHTTDAAMPTPCSARAAMRASITGATAASTLATAYSPKPPNSTGRRPKRSANGPISNCAKPKLSSSADMVSCTAAIGACKSMAKRGSAGKYRSVVTGCKPSSKARASAAFRGDKEEGAFMSPSVRDKPGVGCQRGDSLGARVQNRSSSRKYRHCPGGNLPSTTLPMRTRLSASTLRPTISHMRRIWRLRPSRSTKRS